MFKWLKIGIVVVVGGCIVGSFIFGKDLVSYLRSSGSSVRQALKDAVPTDFELRRAGDLLEEIIPEMHKNIQLIAQEEVEIAALKGEIVLSQKFVVQEQERIEHLRNQLALQKAGYMWSGRMVSRDQMTQDLSHRFDQFKESALLLESKRRLLVSREKSLQAAVGLLEKTRSQKNMLANKIKTLESQYRLIQASAVGSKIHVDNSKLTQTAKLIGQIKKRLDIAERVLAHESRFVVSVPTEQISEVDLLAQVDEYFQPKLATGPDTNGGKLLVTAGDETSNR